MKPVYITDYVELLIDARYFKTRKAFNLPVLYWDELQLKYIFQRQWHFLYKIHNTQSLLRKAIQTLQFLRVRLLLYGFKTLFLLRGSSG